MPYVEDHPWRPWPQRDDDAEVSGGGSAHSVSGLVRKPLLYDSRGKR